MPLPTTIATDLLVPCQRALSAQGPECRQLAIEHGRAILADAGLDPDQLTDPTTRLPHAIAIALLADAVAISGDPTFALRAGQVVQRGDFGLYDLFTLSAATLGESMQKSAHYLPLLHDGARIELVTHGDFTHWTHFLPDEPLVTPASNEYVVSAFHHGAQASIGLDVPPTEVHFMHAAPAHHEAYRAVFGTHVRFGCERNAIVMPSLALQLPLTTADPVLHRVLQSIADERLAKAREAPPFTQQVATIVRAQLAESTRLATVADTLHMSESTVQRKLQAEGTSHTEVLDRVRRELAMELLRQPDLNVSQVAYQLGFAHRPAFHRAFKRWFGVSPSAHRQRAERSAFYRFYHGA